VEIPLVRVKLGRERLGVANVGIDVENFHIALNAKTQRARRRMFQKALRPCTFASLR
jgi:hypothetical protein